MRAALYARYSSDKQSGASIADQIRVCGRLAERHGFSVVATFSDAAISGGTAQRPGYQAMLEAARRGELDVIVAEDTSRLWRNMAEQSPRIAELVDLGVHVVTHDLDTRTESAGMLGAVLGASSEAYRREIGRRTRRGLEGLARAQRPTGGRAYGYTVIDGDRRIEAAQAAIVRELFDRFAAGETLRALATDLNGRGIPSPGAAWNRTKRARDGLWRISALHTLLQNPIYVGRLIWNRARWVRSAADSSKRRYVENPPSEWIVHEQPALRIVDQATFERAQRRFAERAELFTPGPGGPVRYLLSGLLRCATCGGAFVVASHRPKRYGCTTHRQAGAAACDNRLQVRIELAERKIIGHIQTAYLAPDKVAHAVKTMRELARRESAAVSGATDLKRLDEQIAELERLRAAGVLSPQVAGAALAKARQEREAVARPRPAVDGLFGAERAYLETVNDMRDALAGDDIGAAREALRAVLPGPIPLHSRGAYLEAEMSGEQKILLVAGAATGVVAGVGFEPTTFGL
jgi:site-specific DNA recombinase